MAHNNYAVDEIRSTKLVCALSQLLRVFSTLFALTNLSLESCGLRVTAARGIGLERFGRCSVARRRIEDWHLDSHSSYNRDAERSSCRFLLAYHWPTRSVSLFAAHVFRVGIASVSGAAQENGRFDPSASLGSVLMGCGHWASIH